MPKIIYPFIIFFLVFILFSACTYNNEEDLYGDLTCDTSNVTYLTHIKPIVEQNCIQCHGNVIQNEGFNFNNESDLKAAASSGRLSGAINHKSGFAPMPNGMPKLDDCKIQIMNKWIENETK